MDKITGITGGHPISGPKRPENPVDSSFRQNLEAANARQQSLATAPVGSAALNEVPSGGFPTLQTPQHAVVRTAQRLLDLLDTYAKDMGNPRKTLKDMEPLIVSIQQRAAQLAEETESLQTEDDALQTLARQCGVTANMECIKFYRGDYV